MSRRDTIIISVLVNAGLLVILFISAISTKESKELDTSIVNNSPIIEEPCLDNQVLFSEAPKDTIVAVNEDKGPDFITLMEERKVEEKMPEMKKEEIIEPKREEIVHKLPELAVEKKEEKLTVQEKPQKLIQIMVKRGDTLDKIAKIHKTKVSEIIRVNNLPSSFLRIGQSLYVPEGSSKNTIVRKQETKKVVPAKTTAEYYIVKSGDNPYTIAIKHHMKPHELLKLNNLDERKARKLKPGDKLRIR